MEDPFARRNRLLGYAGVTLVLATGARTLYALSFERPVFARFPHGEFAWALAYGVFVLAYALMPRDGATVLTRRRGVLVAVQSVAGLAMVAIYPSFIGTCLLAVVAWEIGLVTELRAALIAATLQVGVLAAIQCANETSAMMLLVVATSAGFQLFALCAAQFARGEIAAREALARSNAELRAAQVMLAESTRMGERLRISRDLHDVLGHSLTSLTIHLDVASRLASGPAVEHLECAREVAGNMLGEVRSVVSRFRVTPPDLRSALEALAGAIEGLRVRLVMPAELDAIDPARADVVLRCVQEVITNTLRHASARELVIELRQHKDGILIGARDDGRGGPIVMGNGLTGMRERFENLGGSLAFDSRDGQGFQLNGTLPPPERVR